ncbi:MAG TPA: hypothetical protein VFV38_00040 [Ktedonobacteraceae bacterium]|nr:hypothetical protein [Ktedonobacteraceae bacterium]
MRDQREVSLLSHRTLFQSVSPPLQRSLLPPLVPAAPSASLAGCFPWWGERRAYHVLHNSPGGLGSACPPEAVLSAKGNGTLPLPGLVPFWFELISIFSSSVFTAFSSSSHVLAIPPTLAPDRLDAGSRPRSSQ